MNVVDFCGNPIRPGEQVVYAVPSRTRATLRTGVVLAVDPGRVWPGRTDQHRDAVQVICDNDGRARWLHPQSMLATGKLS